MKRHGSPEAITTDGLRSYRAAMNELGNAGKQIGAGRVASAQLIAVDEDDAAQHPPAIDPRLAMALGKERLQPRHLLVY